MRHFWLLSVLTLAMAACGWTVRPADATAGPPPQKPAAVRSYTFEGGALPAVWRTTGDVTPDGTRNCGAGPGGSLRIGPGGSATLQVAKSDRVGKVEFWVLDDGTTPADSRAYRDGPVWGVRNAEGAVEGVGIIYAPYLDGAKTYAVGMSRDGKFLYRNVVYLGIARDKDWHKWTFVFDNATGWKVFRDDKDVDAGTPRIIQDNIYARGFSSVVIAGDMGQDHGQTLWVDNVTVTDAGPLTSTGVPDSKVMPGTRVPPGGFYATWRHGPPKDPHWFPIGVWLQDPKRAPEFKAIGINQYIGLWEGPTEAQLAELKKARMPVICDQNAVGLRHLDDPTIVAWMQIDEPDNAQPDGKGGYGPPVTPEKIVERYRTMKAADPSRPVYLGVGQAVAWDRYYGRGTRTNKPEDYPRYAQGADILSFDVYPVVSTDGEVQGKLWKVPFGVERLVGWAGPTKPVWNAIECTRISNPNAKATPAQVRSEVWMSLIHGSRGIVYFVHQFQEAGKFIEAALLEDKQMCEGIRKLNAQIIELAPVLNSPTIGEAAKVAVSNRLVPVDMMVKRYGGATYLFAVAMRDGPTKATFTVKGLGSRAMAEAVGEGRRIRVTGGKFTDDFAGYGVHIYRIAAR